MNTEGKVSSMFGECLETEHKTDKELLSISKPCRQEVIDQLIELLARFGVDPAITYAVKKLGYVITDYNIGGMSQEQKAKWLLAMQEYYVVMKNNGMQ